MVFEIKNIISHLAPKIWIFGINLIKCIQNVYEGNDKTLTNEVKEELYKWRDIPCS